MLFSLRLSSLWILLQVHLILCQKLFLKMAYERRSLLALGKTEIFSKNWSVLELVPLHPQRLSSFYKYLLICNWSTNIY